MDYNLTGKLILNRISNEFQGEKVGSIMISVESIESIESYDTLLYKGSSITLKNVITGFDDNDRPYRMQKQFHVKEDFQEIMSLIEKSQEVK